MPRLLANLLIVTTFFLGLTACGGGSSAPPPATGGGTQQPPPGGGGSAVSDPVVITVTPGVTTAGVNIAVPSKSGGEPNSELLGVTPVGEGGSAQNTGAAVRRGQTARVILFGNELTGDMTILIGGANDIQVSNIESIKSTSGKAGVAFQVSVAGNAAVGARTVFLRKGENITAFSGGLEVLP